MVDVLVIGAGPTGLMMAVEAARFGLSCRIIDQSPAPSERSKALAIQPRTLEIFDHLGIVDRFLAEGTKIHGANPFFGEHRLAHLSLRSVESPYPFILSLEQSSTERVLAEYLGSLGVQIEREKELISLQQDEEKVTALIRGHQEEKIQAKWVIGCDGAHSVTRKQLDFSFEGRTFPILFGLADVRLEWNHSHDELFAFISPDGVLAVIPMPGENRFRLVFQLESEESELTLATVQQRVARSIGPNVRVLDPTWIAHFRINNRLVKEYRKGRIFLAGDAAHIHSPVGGQGMNSGIQDAFNLGWKLASGNEGVIDTYSSERLPWGRSLVKQTWRFTKLATMRNSFCLFLRNWLIQQLAPRLEQKLTSAIAQVSIRYPKSCVVQETGRFLKGPHAGTRAPNIPVGSADLYSIIRNSTVPHLLCFGCKPQNKAGVISIAVQDPRALEIYGIQEPSVYLIRPDQYIGYRGPMESFRGWSTR